MPTPPSSAEPNDDAPARPTDAPVSDADIRAAPAPGTKSPATRKKLRKFLFSFVPLWMEVLSHAQYFAPAPIPERIFLCQGGDIPEEQRVLSPKLLRCVRNAALWERVLSRMEKFQVITAREANVSFTIDSNFQKTLPPKFPGVTLLSRMNGLCSLICAAYDSNAPDKWDYMTAMLPHFERMHHFCTTYSIKSIPSAVLAVKISHILCDLGKYSDAEEMDVLAEGIYGAIPGVNEEDVAILNYNRAVLYTSMGRYDTAIGLLESALPIHTRHHGTNDKTTGNILSVLALAHRNEKRMHAAEALYRQSLAVQETIQATETPDYATTLYSFAGLLNDTKREVAAWEMYEQALAIERRVLPPNHPSLGKILSSMGRWKLNAKMYDDARVLFEQALAIKQRVLPAEHPSLLRTERDYALLLQDMGLAG